MRTIMNIYHFVAECRNEVDKVKEDVASLKECQHNLDERIKILERSTPRKWPMIVFLVAILASTAMATLRFSQSPDKTMVLNFTFDLHDSWLNYVIQQIKAIHFEEEKSFSIWEIKWHIDAVVEKASTKEVFKLTITASPSQLIEEISPEVQVLFFDEKGQPLSTDEEFVPFLTNATADEDSDEDSTNSTRSSQNAFIRSIDVLGLRKMNLIKKSIEVALHIRRSK